MLASTPLRARYRRRVKGGGTFQAQMQATFQLFSWVLIVATLIEELCVKAPFGVVPANQWTEGEAPFQAHSNQSPTSQAQDHNQVRSILINLLLY
jgi:hypothetical protein